MGFIKTFRILLYFFVSTSPAAAWAIEEQDLATGDSQLIRNSSLPEPVYLDELSNEKSSPQTQKQVATPTINPPVSGSSLSVVAKKPEQARRWRLHGSLGASTITFAARATIAFAINRYLSFEPGLAYWNQRDGTYSGTGYGPELPFVAQIPNPTMFVPFVGTGLGYERWDQYRRQEILDSGDSATVFYFFGLNLFMTDHFGFSIARRGKHYASSAPLDKDSGDQQANPQIATEIAFLARF